MPLVILHHLLNVFVQLPNKRGLKKMSKHYNLVTSDHKILTVMTLKITLFRDVTPCSLIYFTGILEECAASLLVGEEYTERVRSGTLGEPVEVRGVVKEYDGCKRVVLQG
jgi:hypothetical protein